VIQDLFQFRVIYQEGILDENKDTVDLEIIFNNNFLFN